MLNVILALGLAILIVGLATLGYSAFLLSGRISEEEEQDHE